MQSFVLQFVYVALHGMLVCFHDIDRKCWGGLKWCHTSWWQMA